VPLPSPQARRAEEAREKEEEKLKRDKDNAARRVKGEQPASQHNVSGKADF